MTNRVQSILLILGMLLILSVCGWVMGGLLGLASALTLALVVIVSSTRLSPALVLRGYKARAISPQAAPGLTQIFDALVHRAGLSHRPTLYYVPSQLLNAFAVGRGEQASIAVTDGLLKALNPREIAAVLAHEISHIRHNDLFVMGLADAFSRVTTIIGQVGQILLLLSIPALLFGLAFPWLGALVLLLAPGANALLQLALSRAREYQADYGAAQLTEDPIGLALALGKIESAQGNWFEKVMLPGRHEQAPALLRTHPKTQDRLARLKAMAGLDPSTRLRLPPPDVPVVARLPAGVRVQRPRWHLSSFWY